jgi:transcriptional regulator with XRE-family HTH domain
MRGMQSFQPKLLRVARRRSGLNQEALGKLLGVSRQVISKWENGGSVPRSNELLLLSIHLGEDLGYFFGEHGSSRVGQEVAA